jgi:hypothetical protein
MSLMYLRDNRTYFHIGHAYGINASTVHRTVRLIEDVLSKTKYRLCPAGCSSIEGFTCNLGKCS